MRRSARLLTWVIVLSAGMLAGATVLLVPRTPTDAASYRPRTVTVPPGTFSHRVDGEFIRDGQQADAPMVPIRIDAPVEVMAFQVTRAEYARCVADGACQRPDRPEDRGELPVTGVNYIDASAYAQWLSQRTGQTWRLPDEHEWAYVAGSRFVDDAHGIDPDDRNPARRWIAEYERAAARKSSNADPRTRPVGSFGANEHGIHDLASNVWEWTRTCHRRVILDAEGRSIRETRTCGVYVAAGRHRAPMTLFVRDPKSGGCSVATPPDHLGFRLVRQPEWREQVVASLRNRLRI